MPYSSSLTWNQPPWCLEAAREDCSDRKMRLARPPLQCEALVLFLVRRSAALRVLRPLWWCGLWGRLPLRCSSVTGSEVQQYRFNYLFRNLVRHPFIYVPPQEVAGRLGLRLLCMLQWGSLAITLHWWQLPCIMDFPLYDLLKYSMILALVVLILVYLYIFYYYHFKVFIHLYIIMWWFYEASLFALVVFYLFCKTQMYVNAF